jgi:CARDB/Bacterial SH3 domain
MRQLRNNDESSFLHNPVALGGIAAVALVVIVAIVVVLLSARSGDNDTSAQIQPGGKTPTKQATNQNDNLSGLVGKATSTINVRSGPSNSYVVQGVLRRGSEVSITGKSDDREWLQIEYPIHSNLHGWVLASSLEVQGDLAAVAIATPESLPMADVPTYEAVETVPAELTPEVTPTITSTPSPSLPDLVVGGSLVSNGVLVITVTNQGAGPLPATALQVGIFDVSGSSALNSTTASVQGLAPGASVDIRTGFVTLGGPAQVLVIVDPSGKVNESDDTNNRLTVSLSSHPTATPDAATTPTADPSTPNP